MRKLKIIAIALMLGLSLTANAKRLHPEKYYQNLWCNGKGATEYVLKDNTRVDCLTNEYAIEADFANKWAESIGQSLHYSRMTGKKAGILLIMEKQNDKKYLDRLQPLADTLAIKVWLIKPEIKH